MPDYKSVKYDQVEAIRLAATVNIGKKSFDGSTNVTLNLGDLNDVSTTNLADGALLQYNASGLNWVNRNELDDTTGDLTLNGGAF
jgi:hypothetical protein